MDLLDPGSPHDANGGVVKADEAAGSALLNYDSDTQEGATVHLMMVASAVEASIGGCDAGDSPARDAACEPMYIDTSTDISHSNRQDIKQDNEQDLDPIYYQCRAARTSTFRDNLVSVSPDKFLGEKTRNFQR
jgi:hypothetical protein